MNEETPIICPNCGHKYDASLHWLVCPNCGHETSIEDFTLQHTF